MSPKKVVCAGTCCSLIVAATMRAETAPAALSPQAESMLRVGARVRLNASDPTRPTLTGRLLRFDERNLVLEVREGADPLEVRRDDIQSLDVSTGQTRRRTGVGARIGLAWTAFGILAIYLWTPVAHYFSYPVLGYWACGIGCALLTGPALGALIGSAVRTEDWRPVKIPRVSAGLVPTKGGVGASVSLRF